MPSITRRRRPGGKTPVTWTITTTTVAAAVVFFREGLIYNLIVCLSVYLCRAFHFNPWVSLCVSPGGADHCIISAPALIIPAESMRKCPLEFRPTKRLKRSVFSLSTELQFPWKWVETHFAVITPMAADLLPPSLHFGGPSKLRVGSLLCFSEGQTFHNNCAEEKRPRAHPDILYARPGRLRSMG